MFALVVGLVLCALVGNDLYGDYEQQFAAATAKTGSLTQLLEEHARQSMQRVELSMSLAAREVRERTAKGGQVSATTGTRLRALLPQDGLIASFAILDATGVIVASTLTENVAELEHATDRDFYLAPRDPSHFGLFVGASVKSRISGLWIIPVSTKLGGGLDGYLIAAVNPEYFQHLYQSIDTGDNGAVTLFTTAGWAVARWPFSSEIAQHNWREAPLFSQHIAHASAAAVRDDSHHVYSYRVLPDYPLVVSLTVSLEESLARWRQRVLMSCAGLLLTLLFLGAAAIILIEQLRRRLRAESALKLSETSVLKSSQPTLWIGQDARIVRVNQAACDLHGLSELQMLGMCIPDLNPAMSMSDWPDHWARLRSAGSMHFETTHRHYQGHDVPVEVDLNFIEFEGHAYNYAFIRDLTVRKQAEAEIQRAAATLRGAIDAVDEAFVLFDKEDRLVYCNAKYLQLYPGLQDVLIPGAKFEDLVRRGAQRGLYRESVGQEDVWVAERLRAHREGKETRIQIRDDGRVLRVIDRKTPDGNIVGIRVDITEMVRATEEAQQASRYKSQFLANMSHEIRTPMNAILGLLALLQNTGLNSVQQDYAAKTESAAQSLLGLLNDILDFSKVEAGKLDLDPQPFRLDRLLEEIAVILGSSSGGKNIEVLFDVDATLPARVLGDSLRLRQVLVNLGGNAIKFTSQGQVVLRVRQGVQPGQEALIEFSLQDTGIGIPADKQAHIFSGFSQAESSTTRRFGGSGLGLAICKRLVELMGGTLALQSTPGLGSCFSFALALPRVATQADEATDPMPPVPTPQCVLVVDDNPLAREMLRGMTQAWGWSTETAAGGAQALDMIRARLSEGVFPFDVICLDWQMPQMDGWETVRRIRALCRNGQRPRIVMLSAGGRDTLQFRTAQEQSLIDGFLLKPVMAQALKDAALGQLRAIDPLARGARSSQRPLAGMRILVVEDNLINQQVAEELLHFEGAVVSLAANGLLGVEAVASSQPPFDVVLMDIQMPVLDGYDATRRIRQQLGLTALPIVAMTANAMASDRVACLTAGMNEHVGKPFEMRHLVTLLLKLTGREGAPIETFALARPSFSLASPDTGGAASIRSGFTSVYVNIDVALERLSGLTSLYLGIAREYIDLLDRVEGEFCTAAAAGDIRALVVQTHSLKGVSATLGAQRLSDHAAQLEKLFRVPPDGLALMGPLPGLLELVALTRAAMKDAVQMLSVATEIEQVAERLPSGPEQRASARSFLMELSGLLAASNLEVLESFALRRHALDALPPQSVEELQLAIQSLNLDRARWLCDAQLNSLQSD